MENVAPRNDYSCSQRWHCSFPHTVSISSCLRNSWSPTFPISSVFCHLRKSDLGSEDTWPTAFLLGMLNVQTWTCRKYPNSWNQISAIPEEHTWSLARLGRSSVSSCEFLCLPAQPPVVSQGNLEDPVWPAQSRRILLTMVWAAMSQHEFKFSKRVTFTEFY